MSENKNKKKNMNVKKFGLSINLDDILTKDEEVIMYGRIHWGIYWKSVAVLIIALLVGLFLFVEIGVVIGIFGVLLLCYGVIKRHMLLLVLTNKRILARYGILQVDVVDVRFRHIESVELERMLPAFIMGYANIIIMGTGNRFIYIPYIANGIAFRRAYNEMVLDEDEIDEDAKHRAERVKDKIGDDPAMTDG